MRKLLGSIVVLVALSVVGSSTLAPFAAAQSKPTEKQKEKIKEAIKDKIKAKAGNHTFEIYKDNSDEFRFRLKDADGAILAMASKGYETKEACQKVIDSIKSHASKATTEDNSSKAKDK